MSHIKHDAIVVTCCYADWIYQAKEKALDIGLQVLGPSSCSVNGGQSILICPDGGKEGWPDSDAGDQKRAAFTEWMQLQAYEDGSNPLRWAHVEYGEINEDDDIAPRVVADTAPQVMTITQEVQ